jgi:hypothetical protein
MRDLDLHSNQNIWHDIYFLRFKMIPSFLSKDIATKILVIGKTINFIIRCRQLIQMGNTSIENTQKIKRGMPRPSIVKALGQDSAQESVMKSYAHQVAQSRFDMSADRSVDILKKDIENQKIIENENLLGGISIDVETAFTNLQYGDEHVLSELVDKVSQSIDGKLLHLMASKFHVHSHLHALKKFMLLGQGDFVTCLMDSVGPELQKSPSKLFRHNLTGILEGALRSSNAQYEPPYVINRVLVRLLEPNPGDSGWEIFSIDYAIDSPLNAVVIKISLFIPVLSNFVICNTLCLDSQ